MCPLGTWSFRARLGGNYARTCRHARARSRQQLRTNWTANGCKPVGLPKVANQLDGQRLQWLGRKVAPFRWVQICWPLLERYIKRSDLSIQNTNTKIWRIFLSSERSLSLYKFWLRSELGSAEVRLLEFQNDFQQRSGNRRLPTKWESATSKWSGNPKLLPKGDSAKILQPSYVLNSGCSSKRVRQIFIWNRTVRWFGSAIQIPWRSIVSWETSVHYPVSTGAGDVIVLRRFAVKRTSLQLLYKWTKSFIQGIYFIVYRD